MTKANPRVRWRQPLAPLVAGLYVALLLAGVGLAFGLTRPVQFRATATLVVLPSRSIPADQAASYYDVLSRGQVVTTFAEILRLRVNAQGGSGPVEVAPVPDTAVIQFSATGSTAAEAQRRANDGFARARRYFSALTSPYAVSVVSDATGSAQRLGTSRSLLLLAVGLAAVLAGAAVATAGRRLQRQATPPAPASLEPGARLHRRHEEEMPAGPAA